MTNTIISLEEMEFACRTIRSGMPWIVSVDAEVEISSSRDGSEVDIEFIVWSNINFLPESKYNDDDHLNFTGRFMEFKSLYYMFLKEDVDEIKSRIEDLAIDRLAND